MSKLPPAAFIILFLAAAAIGAGPDTRPSNWAFALAPPMGWNSYDTFGDSVTEAEVVANAEYMRDHLLSHGWNYVVVDFRWYDAGANSGDPNKRAGAQLTADEFGRLTPAVNRFPSADGGKGFGPLGEKIHAMGLKFGIHVMRGIPQQSFKANTPIEGSSFHAADAGDSGSICRWCKDMYGVHGETPAGQAWYDSIVRQYAGWGVDYIKVDDLSSPYSTHEIEALRAAIDKCGRAMVLSLSPGPTPVKQAEHVKVNANLWRISADFWDRWRSLNSQFDLIASWQGVGGPGRWPDADMIPLGHIGIRCDAGGAKDRQTRFTKDEQLTLMSLWALAPSPLMLGMNMPDNDEWTNSLLTNDAVIAIDQDSLGAAGELIGPRGMQEVWKKKLANGDIAVGLFNRAASNVTVSVTWAQLGISGKQTVRDLWQSKDIPAEDKLSTDVPVHGSVLVRIAPQK